MNVEQMLIETLNDDDVWGQRPWTDPVARITARYRRRRRRRLAVAGTAAALAVVTAAVVGLKHLPGDSDARLVPSHVEQGDAAPISGKVRLDGLTWTITASPESAGSCVALTIGVDTMARGCGVPIDLLLWGVGQSREPGHYRYAYGRAPAGAVEVRVTLADGTQLADRHLIKGRLWLVVRKAQNPSGGKTFKAVVAVDADGRVIARQAVPTPGG